MFLLHGDMGDAALRCGLGLRAGVVRIKEVSDNRKCSEMFKHFIVTLCHLLFSYEDPANFNQYSRKRFTKMSSFSNKYQSYLEACHFGQFDKKYKMHVLPSIF